MIIFLKPQNNLIFKKWSPVVYTLLQPTVDYYVLLMYCKFALHIKLNDTDLAKYSFGTKIKNTFEDIIWRHSNEVLLGIAIRYFWF